MTINEQVGNNIKKYRIAHNYTLKEMSALIHKSCSTLSKYESGSIPISIETIEEFSKIFQVPLACFLPVTSESDDTKRGELFKTYYMYTYDGRRKKILKGIIEEFYTSSPSLHSVQLFYDVDQLENFKKCGVIYSGESMVFGPWQNYHLKNHSQSMEDIWMCVLNTFSQTDKKTGILSGISQLTMQPGSRKVLITSKIEKEDTLMDELLFSKEDILLAKKYNIFSVREQ